MSKKKKQRLMELFDENGQPIINHNGHGGGNSRSFQGKEKKIDRYKKNVIVSAQTDGQRQYMNEIKNNDIVFCYGPAGTGKTAVAVGVALQYICAPEPTYNKLIVMRPAKEACDERIGFLPGDMDDKMAPWAAPIVDNMQVFIEPTQIKNLMWEKKIEVIPLAFARGRSLNNAFIIVDEAQNVSPKQMLMVLTRLGKNSKMVLNGDLAQSDVRGASGLFDAIERLQDIPNISFCQMNDKDIVRHPLIAKILERYVEEEQPAA